MHSNSINRQVFCTIEEKNGFEQLQDFSICHLTSMRSIVENPGYHKPKQLSQTAKTSILHYILVSRGPRDSSRLIVNICLQISPVIELLLSPLSAFIQSIMQLCNWLGFAENIQQPKNNTLLANEFTRQHIKDRFIRYIILRQSHVQTLLLHY